MQPVYTHVAGSLLSLLARQVVAAPPSQAYLDDFEKFCSKLGGATAEVMGDLLAFEVWAFAFPVLTGYS
jgi:hypothetical protein